jgi:hypothetical protein
LGKRLCITALSVWACIFFLRDSEAAQTSTNGLWQSASPTDQLSGKKVVLIALDPISDTDNEFSQSGIIIACKPDGTIQFQLNWDKKISAPPNTESEVDYRVGHGEVQSETWDLTTDFMANLYRGNVVNFINQLETSSIFVAQVTPLGMKALTATFDTTGLSHAVVPVLKACGFSQPS